MVESMDQWRECQTFYHLLCLVLFRIDAPADFSFCCDQDCPIASVLERDKGE